MGVDSIMWVLGTKLTSSVWQVLLPAELARQHQIYSLYRPLIHCLPGIVWKKNTEATSAANDLSAGDDVPWLASPFSSCSTHQMDISSWSEVPG